MQLKQNRNLTFWSLHAMGWSAYAMSQYLGALLYGKGIAYQKVILVATLSGFLVSSWLRYAMPLAVEQAAPGDGADGAAVRLCHRADLAHPGELGLPHDVSGRADALHALDGLLQRHDELDISNGVLDGPVLRLSLLRVDAGAARSGAAFLGAGAGSAAQDAAVPAQPAFSFQYAERDLDADPRQSQHTSRTPR